MYTVHVISQIIDGGATEADGGASAPVGPSVATPLLMGQSHYFKLFFEMTAVSEYFDFLILLFSCIANWLYVCEYKLL